VGVLGDWLVGGWRAGSYRAGGGLARDSESQQPFLGRGIVALASLLAAAASAVLGPALARALPFCRPRSQPAALANQPVTAAGLLLLAPLLALVFEVAVFFIVWRTRAPLSRDVRVARAILAGALTAALPWVMGRASLVWPRLSWPKALAQLCCCLAFRPGC